MKSYFCCGMCTSSRVESKHRLFKKNLKSSTHLTEFFKVLRELKEIEIFQFKDEVTKLNKRENKQLGKTSLIKFYQNDYSQYALVKMKDELLESMNYKLLKKQRQKWYKLFIFYNS